MKWTIVNCLTGALWNTRFYIRTVAKQGRSIPPYQQHEGSKGKISCHLKCCISCVRLLNQLQRGLDGQEYQALAVKPLAFQHQLKLLYMKAFTHVLLQKLLELPEPLTTPVQPTSYAPIHLCQCLL
jgi:hypothetical protein